MNEELNKKLAEWAGFKWHKKREYVHGWMMHGGSWHKGHWDYNGECWYETLDHDKGCFGEGQLPDFTSSLDACFKWLVPKVNELKRGVDLQQASDNGYWKATLWDWTYSLWELKAGDKHQFPISETDFNSPALALCLAIEKLIDGEAH